MRQLKRVVDNDERFGLGHLGERAAVVGFVEIFLPRLVEALVLVPTVSERPDGVDVEWVFPLADDGLPIDDLGLVCLAVDLTRVVAKPLVEER